MISLALFSFFAAITIGFACVVTFAREVFRASFGLMGTLIGVAGLIALSGNTTVAALQILIYVGGVFVLFLFAILVTERPGAVLFRRSLTSTFAAGSLASATVALLLTTVTAPVFQDSGMTAAAEGITARQLGFSFLSDNLLAFEVVSVLLLAALIGAIIVIRKELEE